jgi:fructose-1,6-bisphosphatase/sedoheptulose 1,7-bisphosphatase-like protein
VKGKSAVELLEVAGGSVEGTLTVVLLVCVGGSIQETLAVGSMRLRAVEVKIVR